MCKSHLFPLCACILVTWIASPPGIKWATGNRFSFYATSLWNEKMSTWQGSPQTNRDSKPRFHPNKECLIVSWRFSQWASISRFCYKGSSPAAHCPIFEQPQKSSLIITSHWVLMIWSILMAQPQTQARPAILTSLSSFKYQNKSWLDRSTPGSLTVSNILQLKHLQMVNCLKQQWQNGGEDPLFVLSYVKEILI